MEVEGGISEWTRRVRRRQRAETLGERAEAERRDHAAAATAVYGGGRAQRVLSVLPRAHGSNCKRPHDMDNLDDSENNAKISDSAYSNSCSNSQSRRSHSSKSTHSGSHSSGSSGYGGKPSAYSDNSGQPAEKRLKEKDGKKKKQVQIEESTDVIKEVEEAPQEQASVTETAIESFEENVEPTLTPTPGQQQEVGSEKIEVPAPERSVNKDEVGSCNSPIFIDSSSNVNIETSSGEADGFSCVISMQDGVVMYSTSSLTTTLGFPKEMWMGRSFIDFVHPKDRNTFASHITSGLAVPKNVNGMQEEAPPSKNDMCTMVCRIRRYRGLSTGFAVKDRIVTFMPFLLKLSFKDISEEEGKSVYLVIQATPFFSAFKTPNEKVIEPVPFVIRHASNGNVEYVDPESVPYLGYLPQDLAEKNALALYHHDDLPYLRHVYETIVREGGFPKSVPYRIMAQNGHFLKVQTEWSSFTNPWSRKLEFVTGKHQIVQGPANPDVFQAPVNNKTQKISEEERHKAQYLRDSIVRVMNEVLTKPAEVAKQQMTRRCQDLATFMESLIEEQPKPEEDLRLEIQDVDNSYFERDSVMLGGISPHHDHDSKSSTETILSYTQINYNETLERYFNSHLPDTSADYSKGSRGHMIGLKRTDSGHLSPMAMTSGDSGELSSSESCVTACSYSPVGDYLPHRLTESLLNKHNTDMEKELMKMHREMRSSKGERTKSIIETRQKKKEHLARCNAAFQPTSVGNKEQAHGVKRSSKQLETEGATHKHQCTTPGHSHSRRPQTTSVAPTIHSSLATGAPTATTSPWVGNAANSMNPFLVGVVPHPQMSMVNPMTGMPGMIPVYYMPAPAPTEPATDAETNNNSALSNSGVQRHQPGMIPMYYMPAVPTEGATDAAIHNNNNSAQNGGGSVANGEAQMQQPVQCMMYGQPMYHHQPIMYAPMNQGNYSLPQNLLTQSIHNQPLGLGRSNYEEACKQNLPTTNMNQNDYWKTKKVLNEAVRKLRQSSSDSLSSSYTFDRSTKAAKNFTPSKLGKKCSEEMGDRTDEGSSYSSFYSSFFKTDSSAEESGDGKKNSFMDQDKKALGTSNHYYEPPLVKKIARRKMLPPWMEQVNLTPDLMYKYQVPPKDLDEVLKADKLKLDAMDQPLLVNEQLEQLYLDLQLEGVTSRLTLEEGMTSSGSSGEDTMPSIKGKGKGKGKKSKIRRKRAYSTLAMIYEEDAPCPSPIPEANAFSPVPGTSQI